MSSTRANMRVPSVAASRREVDLSALTLAELRMSRRQARGQLEVAQLRARQAASAEDGPIERLKELVDRLTDELISRYERNPDLIDLILSEAPDGQEGQS